MHGLYAPGLDIITDGIANDLRVFDPGLVLVFNKRCYRRADGTWDGRFEIYDKNAPGGPKWQLVLRVPLTEDGRLRFPDQRELDALRQSRGRTVDQLLDEMEERSDARDAAIEREHQNLAAAMTDDFKYAFRHITDTVESRNRSREAWREEIRREALTPQ